MRGTGKSKLISYTNYLEHKDYFDSTVLTPIWADKDEFNKYVEALKRSVEGECRLGSDGNIAVNMETTLLRHRCAFLIDLNFSAYNTDIRVEQLEIRKAKDFKVVACGYTKYTNDMTSCKVYFIAKGIRAVFVATARSYGSGWKVSTKNNEIKQFVIEQASTHYVDWYTEHIAVLERFRTFKKREIV